MRRIALAEGADLDGFRRAARHLIHQGATPDQVEWTGGENDLLWSAEAIGDAPTFALPAGVDRVIGSVICHRDREKYALLYQLVWRLRHGERSLLSNPGDKLTHRLELMQKTIRRDIHKMHAFLRFREVSDEKVGERFVAWFEPDHFILRPVAGFFVKRFRSMHWSILTPVGALHWDGETLMEGPPARREDAPDHDRFEDGWRQYYTSIFNPTRVNPRMMMQEMPKKYWKNLPEAALIPELVQSAQARVKDMIDREATTPVRRTPEKALAAMRDQAPKTLSELNERIIAAGPLVPGATQAVLGEGPFAPLFAFVGEQPGDAEDREGRPFVGPAGQLLDRALAQAGIDRSAAYMTNAVKHFKFEQRGKQRIHQKPTAGEVKHYRWWLEKELELVNPRFVVALGSTAGLALTGQAVSVLRQRGPILAGDRPGYLTVHPSYILRLQDESARQEAFDALVADLRSAAESARAATATVS